MTSDYDAKKTNEFLRRRKLRLLQVREQSKEIAKKIRQRANVEKIRNLEGIDEKFKKEYLEHQNNFIRKLEQYYADGVSSVGTGHKNASNVNLQETKGKPDLSLKRGREAFAELKRKKQELLDERKKLLDRRLQAREIANEISKEKSTKTINKLLSKATQAPAEGKDIVDNPANDITIEKIQNTKPGTVTSDMATQWDLNEIPKEWEPNVPNLCLNSNSNEDEHIFLQTRESSSDKPSKKTDLFAVSDEMPTSLRGRLPCVPEEPPSSKSSLTLVTEYLRNRDLRLREGSTMGSSKPSHENLPSVKATLLKTRAARLEVKEAKENPSDNNEGLVKSSVKIYNHSTRNVRDVPRQDDIVLVSRDPQSNDDAYSQAVKESTSENKMEREHQKRLTELRGKIAVTRQSVEKEYKDTMDFLGTLSKEKSKPMKTAHLDEHRQQIQRQHRQRKLQQEYTQIERECKRHHHNTVDTPTNRSNRLSGSDDEFASKDFQYSWMPVPDSDENLAIHTIPTTFKPNKSGNSVKFNKVDSYHEYRSRHKHTPPTKEALTNNVSKPRSKKLSESVTPEDDSVSVDDDTTESSDTNTSSVQVKSKKSKRKNKKFDIEKIIVYKILQSKIENKSKGKSHTKLLKNLVKSLSSEETNNIIKTVCMSDDENEKEQAAKSAESKTNCEQLKEGIYKAVNEEGRDNVASLYNNYSSQESNTPHGDNFGRQSPEKTTEASYLKRTNSQNKCPKKQIKKTSGSQNGSSECDVGSSTTQTSSDKSVSATKLTQGTQIPQVPSSTSFQSAVTNAPVNLAKNGLIKIIDEGIVEPGNFYVGATGFLQDNDYEVVIKLKKKHSQNEKQIISTLDKKTNVESSKTIESKEETLQEKSDLTNKKDMEMIIQKDSEGGETRSLQKTNSEYIQKDHFERVPRQNTDENEQQKTAEYIQVDVSTRHNTSTIVNDSANDARLNQCVGRPEVKQLHKEDENSPLNTKTPTKTLQDKSISTSPIPLLVTNDVPIRNANTISTQTTLDSIDRERPALHMSSTSTAYMSPPNYVLPAYFKNKCDHRETLDQNGNLRDNKTNSDVLKETYESYKRRKCKSCQYDKNIICYTSSSPNPISNGDDRGSPGYDSASMIHVTLHNINKKKKYGHSNSSQNSLRSIESLRRSESSSIAVNHRHRKDRHGKSKKVHKCKKNTQSSKLRSSRASLVLRPGLKKASSSTKRNMSCMSKSSKALNPIIKSYIHNLLDLNRESIKALAVMNQDCSSVTTPGSSVVDEPHNINFKKTSSQNISLQKIYDILKQQILEQININSNKYSLEVEKQIRKSFQRYTEPKSCYKVKSINISKQILTPKEKPHHAVGGSGVEIHLSTDVNNESETVLQSKSKHRSSEASKSTEDKNISREKNILYSTNCDQKDTGSRDTLFDYKESATAQKNVINTNTSRENNYPVQNNSSFCASTQTNKLIDNDVNYMELAEHKLHNMEKIAHLTERCTKRLSNLAKVLEEVRRNKLTYSQMSDSSGESDRKSETLSAAKHGNRPITPHFGTFPVHKNTNEAKNDGSENTQTVEPMLRNQESVDGDQKGVTNAFNRNLQQSVYQIDTHKIYQVDSRECQAYDSNSGQKSSESAGECVDPFLISDQINISKEIGNLSEKLILHDNRTEDSAENVEATDSLGMSLDDTKDIPKDDKLKNDTHVTDIQTPETESCHVIKNKSRPPPALSRIILKNEQEDIVPHELSTVIEVDSPLSVKLKNQSHAVNTSCPKTESVEIQVQETDISSTNNANPDLAQMNLNNQNKTTSKDFADDSKIKMMDLKQFNEIMLRPFISLQEYAKQCNVGTHDDGTNIDGAPKDGPAMEDLSSLQSDGSLPDVIAELLKRNIINEPFKFDVASNQNSTTLSSESTFSYLTLSKVQRPKKKVSKVLKNKENIAESSDSLSISSNPDLENVFKQLGLGWASSTLKKTKERLALSSSSNSSGSFSQFRVKKKDLVSNSFAVDDSKKQKVATSCKNAEQQTSNLNTMTVKEFLTNELAKKMTFTHKSRKKNVSDEFVSLSETKNPDQLTHVSQGDRSADSGCSESNNRARTSTPVQIFKSNAYHSSTSSNMSNGLFSNLDDLSSVKVTSTSPKHNSTSEKDDLTIPNCSLRKKKGSSDCTPSD